MSIKDAGYRYGVYLEHQSVAHSITSTYFAKCHNSPSFGKVDIIYQKAVTIFLKIANKMSK